MSGSEMRGRVDPDVVEDGLLGDGRNERGSVCSAGVEGRSPGRPHAVHVDGEVPEVRGRVPGEVRGEVPRQVKYLDADEVPGDENGASPGDVREVRGDGGGVSRASGEVLGAGEDLGRREDVWSILERRDVWSDLCVFCDDVGSSGASGASS